MRLAQVVGQSYGRLLALLAGQSRDIAAAEDALADALERALQRWPHDGVPANPEAWLLTVARNRLRDMWKSPAHRMSRPWTDDHDAAWEITDPATFPDRRLELMLVCAHPAIASDIGTPLMLQTVLGVDAAAIGAAFAVAPATMAQRLVWAKKRIRDAGIPFTMPERTDLDARLPEVLEAVYGAYSIDWLSVPQGEAVESLSSEALHKLYRALLRVGPSLGAAVALAALDGEIDGAHAGLRALDALTDRSADRFQPAWVTRGHLLAEQGRFDEAVAAYRRAIELTADEAVRRYLRGRLERLRAAGGRGPEM